jgi:hypothetical protein
MNKKRIDLNATLQTLRFFSKDRILLSPKIKRLATTLPSGLWLESIRYGNGALSSSDRKKSGASKGSSQKGRSSNGLSPFALNGKCFHGGSEQELKIINDWAKKLQADKDFMGKYQKAAVTEIRRGKHLDQDVTLFQLELS